MRMFSRAFQGREQLVQRPKVRTRLGANWPPIVRRLGWLGTVRTERKERMTQSPKDKDTRMTADLL